VADTRIGMSGPLTPVRWPGIRGAENLETAVGDGYLIRRVTVAPGHLAVYLEDGGRKSSTQLTAKLLLLDVVPPDLLDKKHLGPTEIPCANPCVDAIFCSHLSRRLHLFVAQSDGTMLVWQWAAGTWMQLCTFMLPSAPLTVRIMRTHLVCLAEEGASKKKWLHRTSLTLEGGKGGGLVH
jgi:hypothetical protein